MSRHPERMQDYLEHILGALERIRQYTSGKSEANFMEDAMLEDAVLRHPEIEFAQINATRNRIIHAYEEVDLKIVWNLIQ